METRAITKLTNVNNSLIYVVLLVIGTIVYVVYQSFSKLEVNVNDTASGNMPFIVINQPNINIFNAQGRPAYQITANTAEKNEQQSALVFNQPVVHFFDATGKVHWQAMAKELVYNEKTAELNDSVILQQINSDITVDIKTKKLTYTITNNTLNLPNKATINYGLSKIVAGSTSIDVNKEAIHFSNHVLMTINVQQ